MIRLLTFPLYTSFCESPGDTLCTGRARRGGQGGRALTVGRHRADLLEGGSRVRHIHEYHVVAGATAQAAV